MKKFIAMILSCILIMSQGTLVFAENNRRFSKYEMVEIDESIPNGSEYEVAPNLLYNADIYIYSKLVLLRLESGQKRFVHKQ